MIDVIIVGAGPAGLSAANVCAKNGLKVKVVDEFMKAGGRLLGQLHEEPDGTWWNGIEEAKKLSEDAQELNVAVECGVSVHNIKQEKSYWKVYTTKGDFKTRALLLATGAAETSLPIPGWTLPGVMSIGAAQVMTNVHRVRVGERGVVIGINILSAAITRELQLAGIEVSSMYLPGKNIVTEDAAKPLSTMKSMLKVASLAPSKLIRLGSYFMKYESLQSLAVRFYPKNGMKVWGMPVHLRKAVLEIVGDKKVEGVKVAQVDVNGEPILSTEKFVPADFVCIAGGLYPLVELAAISGCPFQYIAELGGHVPVHNENMKTPIDGLYVAGNITGIESAKVAMKQGAVAGYSISMDLLKTDVNIEDQLQQAINHVKQTRNQATIQFHPDIHSGREKIHASFKNTLRTDI
ncbi:NAD(P)/FAD-dependent oxidoreductase [Chengkuizengella axinellae]|uniref:NAD(P)/FAD-dependent oxidoreductase n=1 Tax=Chengkuizengella axinellae TaxID=3064388 RepID=A0ABT9J1N8_9BACL|nr:NAD(P)/FAD-dependent oxidoreductase [Chengkuizengella sp. 2205SS18-9]MDP5275530.1 NAD(P)/FAD-dependent oxidoreductase [Chengkuizengella sp. 2205SS18-9]